jgi:ATP-dependent DNA ligase
LARVAKKPQQTPTLCGIVPTNARMFYVRNRPSVGYIPPCLPSRGERLPSGPKWLHEIKHDGFRIMARRNGDGIQLYTRNGYDFAGRFPQIAFRLAFHRWRCRGS